MDRCDTPKRKYVRKRPGRAPDLTVHDIPRIKQAMETVPVRNYTALARAIGRDRSALRAFIVKHGIPFEGLNRREKPPRAPGVVGEVFDILDRQGLLLREIAKKMNYSVDSISQWRQGRCSPSAFNLECLAQIAGVRLVVAEAA